MAVERMDEKARARFDRELAPRTPLAVARQDPGERMATIVAAGGEVG